MTGQFLGEGDAQEIAQWIEELDHKGQITKDERRSSIQFKLAWSQISSIGYLQQVKQTGSRAFKDIMGLRVLVKSKRISPDVASAYLRSKYPNQIWQAGLWKKGSAQDSEKKANDAAAAGDSSFKVASKANPGQYQGAPLGGSQPLGAQTIQRAHVEQLPDEYDAQDIQEAMESLSTQVSAQMQAVASGRSLQLEPGSISGSVLSPGTVPATALAPLAIERKFVQLPGEELAVRLDVGHSNNCDRWAVVGANRGPGRVWQVTRAGLPTGFKPSLGPVRYRIPLDRLAFGVSSILMNTSTWTGGNYVGSLEVRYGVVLRGVPSFWGRRPTAIRALCIERDVLSSARYTFDNGGQPAAWPSPDRLMEDRAEATLHTAPWPGWASYNLLGSNLVLTPTATALDSIQGLSVQVITGESSDDVWFELNTRQCHAGAQILGRGDRLIASAPSGLELSPIAPPSAIHWDGGALTLADYDHLGTAAAATDTALVQGVPFLHNDCGQLVARKTSFSLAVQVIAMHPAVQSGTWPSPSQWWAHGLAVGHGRPWVLDVIVE